MYECLQPLKAHLLLVNAYVEVLEHTAGMPTAQHAPVQVQAGDFTAKKEIVALERRGDQAEGTGVLSFEFRKQLFEYDEGSNTFSKLAFPVEVSAYCRSQSMPFCHHVLRIGMKAIALSTASVRRSEGLHFGARVPHRSSSGWIWCQDILMAKRRLLSQMRAVVAA